MVAARLGVALLLLLVAGCAGPSDAQGRDADADDLAGGMAGWSWSQLTDLPSPRTEAGAVAAAGRVWLIGGILDEPGGGAVGEVWSMDPASGVWERGPDLPHPVHHAAIAAPQDEIHVIGGFVGSPSFLPSAAVWVLDAADPAQGWQPAPPLPAPRGAAIAVHDGLSVYVAGGMAGVPVYLGPDRAFLEPSVLRLSPGEVAWQGIADLPDTRDHLAAGFHDGRMYIVGGRDLTLDTNTGRLDILDVATGTWSQGPDMPTSRGGLGAGIVALHLVVVGGEGMEATYADVEAYDLANGTWHTLEPMPQARHGVGVAALGDDLYVLGGGPQPAFTYSATVQRLARGVAAS